MTVKVLHIHGRMGRGGTEVRTMELFRSLERRRWSFDFCAVSGLRGEFDEEIRSLGGQVHYLRTGLPGFPRRFRDLLRREQYDVVHSHLGPWSGYLLKLAAQCGVPGRMAHFRSTGWERCGSGLRRFLRALLSPLVPRFGGLARMRRLTDRYATHLVGASEAALAMAWKPDWQFDPRCRVVYDGFSPASLQSPPDREGVCREFHLPSGANLCIHVGRITEPKNHLRLVEIFSRLLGLRPQARLLLVGRTDDAGIARRLDQRIEELGIDKHVVQAGDRPDAPRLIQSADLMVFPSRSEGLGGVAIESAAAGVPVVASDLPSLREIASRLPGVHVLPLALSDESWAEAIHAILCTGISPAARRAAHEAFRDSEFHLDRCRQAMCRLWQEASGGRGELHSKRHSRGEGDRDPLADCRSVAVRERSGRLPSCHPAGPEE